MKTNEFLKPIILITISGLSLSSYPQNQKYVDIIGDDYRQARASLAIRIPITKKLDLSDNLVDPFLQKVLKSYGVSIDQQSEIKFHEENSYINLSCFNCVIGVHNNENSDAMPDNKTGGDRRFK